MLKMRTEPANAGGGGAVASQPVILANKSQQDVEAAYAIAQLSEQAPRAGTDCHELTMSDKADSQLTNGTSSPPRFSHLRTAVMPNACSRVEKAAVKRKFNSRDDHAAVRSYTYKLARLQDVPDPVQRAITSERDSFMTARRHQYLPRTDAAGETELVGRFVRTCAPSGREDFRHQLYVTVSDPTVSPTLVSSIPSLLTTSGSSRMTLQDKSPPVLSPAVTKHSWAVPSVSQHQRRGTCHNDHEALRLQDARRTISPKHSVILPQRHHISVPSTARLPDNSREKLQGLGAFRSSAYEDKAGQRRERLSSSLVDAYYSLGQMAAAAAAASQPPHSHLAVSNSRVQLTSQSQRPPCVDSRTLNKVRQGEFGVLSTLRRYRSQLRRHSEPTDVKGSASHDKDVALDLSMRKHTATGDAEESWCDVVDSEWYNKTSRSCGSSPNVREGEVSARRWTLGQMVHCSPAVQQQMNSFSLPCSPYTSERSSERRHTLPRSLNPRQRTCHNNAAATVATAADNDAVTERTGGDMTEAPDVIPNSQLPLKKRRLHNHHQQPQQPAISEDNCDKQWTSETTMHESSSSPSSAAAADREVKESNVERASCSRAVFLHRDEDGDLPLHIAVTKGTAAAVDSITSVMMSLGISLDYCNNRSQTALHLAVLTDQADIIGRLLDCGASSDVVDARGQTCVHVAVLLGTTSCLRQLLKHSRHPPSINAISHDGVTALHLAVQRGNTDAVRCLLTAGADVDVVDTKYGRTALYYAMQRSDTSAAELLLSYGANPALSTYSGCTTPTVQAAYSSKCSTDMLHRIQPAINYYQPPACCPTG